MAVSNSTMEVAPANINPFETNRLLQELSKYYDQTIGSREYSERVKDYSIKVISGETQGVLWLKQPDAAAAVAIMDRVEGLGMRVIYLYADNEHQDLANISEFLKGISEYAGDHGGLFAVANSIPGVPLKQQTSIMEPMGYVHFGRKMMKLEIASNTPKEPSPLPYGKDASVTINRIEELVNLYALSYEGHKDQVFSEKPKDAKGTGRKYLEDFFLDVDIPTAPWGTFGVEHEGTLIAAVLAREEFRASKESRVRWIYDLMVDPAHRGKGIGRHLMSKLAIEARGRGVTELWLEVTDGNPAEKLYQEYGFALIPNSEGMSKGLWVKASTLGTIGIKS